MIMYRIRTWNQASTVILLGVLLCIAIIPAVSAFTATQSSSGTTLYPGDAISIQIDGLADGDQFTYKLTSSDLQTPGSSVTLTGVNMPFAFQTGTSQTSLTTTGTTSGSTSLTVTASDGSSITVPSSGNTISTSKNVKKDTYTVSMSGTKTSTDAPIGIDYSVSGKASAPINPSTLSFTVTNVNTGHLTVEILQGTTSKFSQTFTIIQPEPIHPPSDSDGGPSGPAGPAAAAPAAQLAPTGLAATTATLQHNEQGQVLASYDIGTDPSAGFTSSLGITSGTAVLTSTGQPVTDISVGPMDAASVPSNGNAAFSFSGFAVECGPSGTQFSSPATISFTLTDAQWATALAAVNGNTAAMSIQTYDSKTNSWTSITTTVNTVTHTISAQVSHFSLYALFYNVPSASTVSTKTIGEIANITSSPTGVTPVRAGTPVNTMLAPVETPQQTPGIFDGIANWFNQLFGSK